MEAFADLPDDARGAFALAATTRAFQRGEAAGGFALALVVEGSFDVLTERGEGAATRVDAGTVIRARGTLEDVIILRLVCASDTGVLATWDDTHVVDAFRTCPWVEDDLRAAGDRLQALAGVTLGKLGSSSFLEVRAQVEMRLQMRVLAESETLVAEGDAVPGLLIVGAGKVELVKGDAVEATVGPGGFVFPTQTLSAGHAPTTARAASSGALVMHADRAATQELVVTQPLLLELLGA